MNLNGVQRSSLRYRLVCNKCNYRFATEDDLNFHTCPDPEFKITGFSCSNCKFVFNFEEPLKRHLKLCYKRPGNINPHVCKLCGEIFDSSKQLSDHELQEHNKKTQFECKYCQAPFSSSRNLIIHERVHEKEPVSCGICKAQFTYFAPLKVHIWQEHQKEMSVDLVKIMSKCKMCHAYYDRDSLHICKQNVIPPSTIESIHGKPPYYCKHCENSFFKYSNYEAHMFSHQVEHQNLKRPTSSNNIDIDLTSEKKPALALTSIIQTSSERPFRCDICGSRFKYDFSLAAHVSSHKSAEKRVIDEFAEIIELHENGSGGHMIEAIDVEDLCRSADLNCAGTSGEDEESKNPSNGLLNLLFEHLGEEDLSSLGLYNNIQTTAMQQSDTSCQGDVTNDEDKQEISTEQSSKSKMLNNRVTVAKNND